MNCIELLLVSITVKMDTIIECTFRCRNTLDSFSSFHVVEFEVEEGARWVVSALWLVHFAVAM